MSLQCLRRTQLINTDIRTCWEFFSDPHRLKDITPEWLGFEVISEVPAEMYQGMVIEYRITPFTFVKTSWVTEITYISEGSFFVDEQRLGPYRFWHHKHFFEKKEKGVMMTDELHYCLPFGVVGDMMNTLIVRKKLEDIFDYRFKILEKLF